MVQNTRSVCKAVLAQFTQEYKLKTFRCPCLQVQGVTTIFFSGTAQLYENYKTRSAIAAGPRDALSHFGSPEAVPFAYVSDNLSLLSYVALFSIFH